MRIPAPLRTRRPAALAVTAVMLATATAVGVAFASGGTHPHKAHAPGASSRAPDATTRAAHTALQRLVANGTISQSQAAAIQRQVAAGSIDPAALIAAGTVNATQMHAIAHALTQVKESFAGSSSDHPAGNKAGAPADGGRAPAVIVHAARAALQQLVANGTIDRAQAATILHLVTTGSIDTHALVANGTVNQAQMRAVQHALVQVKLAAVSHS
jgi:hypothetical protein